MYVFSVCGLFDYLGVSFRCLFCEKLFRSSFMTMWDRVYFCECSVSEFDH